MVEINIRRNESLETAEAFNKKKQKITDYWKKTEGLIQDNKTKSVIEF